MTAAVYQLPGPAAARPSGLNLTDDEVRDAAGGYCYPARQLRELHDRGYTLAYMGKNNRVVLPRAHYDAVVSGQFRREPDKPAQRQPPQPNRDALMNLISQRRKK
ncbi:MAG: hypothetical protein JWQ03_601 [Variovorax sp.]|nr:hypothetical protein [Variovorax sp.]